MQFIANARGRAKRKRVFEGRLSPATLKRVERRREFLELPAVTRTLSFLVCRIRGFDELTESFSGDPEALARLTRLAMTPIAQAVLDRHGTIDRIVPGELSAFFNAPLDDPQHAIHACGAAITMMEAVEKVNRTLEFTQPTDETPAAPIGIGIGIYTGGAVVGNFGTETAPVYTAAG